MVLVANKSTTAAATPTPRCLGRRDSVSRTASPRRTAAGSASSSTPSSQLLPDEGSRTAQPRGPRRVALLGKPNVGKSSLLNKLAGEDRVVVDSVAGTTVDPVDELVEIAGTTWRFVDTAPASAAGSTRRAVTSTTRRCGRSPRSTRPRSPSSCSRRRSRSRSRTPASCRW
ncbi:MAG: GTPase [Candidatus Nanopelagicales bacterium]